MGSVVTYIEHYMSSVMLHIYSSILEVSCNLYRALYRSFYVRYIELYMSSAMLAI